MEASYWSVSFLFARFESCCSFPPIGHPMQQTSYRTAPLASSKMPPGIPYIVANEAAERFSFYGMRAILTVFMTQYLVDSSGALAVMSDSEARKYFHLFVASAYLFPFIGAIIADAFWGKYRTIINLSIVYCLGHACLAIDETRLGLFGDCCSSRSGLEESSRVSRRTWAISLERRISICWGEFFPGSIFRSTWGRRRRCCSRHCS